MFNEMMPVTMPITIGNPNEVKTAIKASGNNTLTITFSQNAKRIIWFDLDYYNQITGYVGVKTDAGWKRWTYQKATAPATYTEADLVDLPSQITVTDTDNSVTFNGTIASDRAVLILAMAWF